MTIKENRREEVTCSPSGLSPVSSPIGCIDASDDGDATGGGEKEGLFGLSRKARDDRLFIGGGAVFLCI